MYHKKNYIFFLPSYDKFVRNLRPLVADVVYPK